MAAQGKEARPSAASRELWAREQESASAQGHDALRRPILKQKMLMLVQWTRRPSSRVEMSSLNGAGDEVPDALPDAPPLAGVSGTAGMRFAPRDPALGCDTNWPTQ